MTFDATRLAKKHLAACMLAFVMVGYSTIPAFATQTETTSYMMPVTAQIGLSASGCSNSPGPYVTLDGALDLSPISAQFTFQNNADGTHSYTSTATASAVPQGATITIPKQPVNGGVGGNPYIFVQLIDGSGNPLTAPVFLGRCVQGNMDGFATFSMPTTLTAEVSAMKCDNTASDIDFGGTMTTDTSVTAKVIFTNNADGTHTNSQVVSAQILPSGVSIEFPKQPSLGGVGGNPWIYLQFQDGNGTPIGSSALLGRCVQNF